MDKKRIVLISAVLIALIVLTVGYDFFYSKILGFASLLVTIEEETMGRVYIELNESIWIGGRESVFVEFTNIGSTNMTSRIEVTIYWYDDGYLNKTAEYNDVSVFLHPGDRKSYRVNFIPPYVGRYYVKVRVPMNYRVMEAWDRFWVYGPGTGTTTTVTAPPAAPSAPAAGGGVSPIYRNPQLRLEYPNRVELYKGETKMINITARNVGDAHLNDLKLSISTSSRLEYSFSPKMIDILWMNNETLFLVTIHAPIDIEEGVYPFDFELLSDEVKSEGEIEVEVLSEPSEEELIKDLWDQILSYELIITEIQRDITSAHLDGFNVALPNQTLNSGRANLEIAKAEYKAENWDGVKDALRKTRENLEDALFQLSEATYYGYFPPAIAPFLILLIIIIVVIIIFIIFFYRRRKKKKDERPKLLRESKQAPTKE